MTLQSKVFKRGQLLRAPAIFRKRDGTLFDPVAVTFRVKRPGSSPQVTELVYGVDADVVKNSVGNYHVLLEVDAAGTWHVRWEGSGPFQAADEISFNVKRGAFA